MMNYFNSSEVIRITKMLKDILNEFELVKQKRARLCAGSYSTHEENEIESLQDPSSYYLFRLLDKSVTITRNMHYKVIPHYSITLENWTPKSKELSNDLLDISTKTYCDFDNFEDAKKRFVDYCLYLLQEEFNIEYIYQNEFY